MNLQNERNYQAALQALEDLKLLPENQKIAEEYLDMTKEADAGLLKKTVRQSFYKMDEKDTQSSIKYINHSLERQRTEEVERYIRLLFAMGGSTICYAIKDRWLRIRYVLSRESSGLGPVLRSVLSPAQLLAVVAEDIVRTEDSLKRENFQNFWDEKNTEVLREARKYCWSEYNNAEILLAAIYLNKKRWEAKEPEQKKGLALLFSKKGKPEEGVRKTAASLEEVWLNNLNGLFSKGLGEKTVKEAQAYLRAGDGTACVPKAFLEEAGKAGCSQYLLQLLCGAAQMAIEDTPMASAFLHLVSEIKPWEVLNACYEMCGRNWYERQELSLEELISMPMQERILWNLGKNREETLARFARKYPQEMEQAVEQVSMEKYGLLMECIKKGNVLLYKKLQESFTDKFEEKVLEEILKSYTIGKNEAKAYLSGEKELDALLPYLEEYRKVYGSGYNQRNLLQKINSASSEQLYRRTQVFWMLTGNAYFLTFDPEKTARGDGARLMGLFEAEKVPLYLQLEALEAAYAAFYQEKDKTGLLNSMASQYRKRPELGDEFVTASKNSTVVGRYLAVSYLDDYKEKYRKELLECALDNSKMVRELLTAVFFKDKGWEEDMKAMLSSKKSQEREMAVSVLRKWGAENYQELFKEVLEKEKSKKIKELLQSCLGLSGEEGEAENGAISIDELVKEIHKGGKKRKVQWTYETPFVPVHKKDGSLAEEEYLQAIAISYADMSQLGINPAAARLAAELNERELAVYMEELFDKWMEAGAESKKKWVLYCTSIHGGEAMVQKMTHQIKEWPQNARGAIAAEAVRALVLNSSPSALLTVDSISRKFKFKQIKAAAGEALEYAATQLGLTKEELADRIVPYLGFNEAMERIFDYGERSFKVYLTPSLELEIFDEKEKKLKSLPAPGKKDDPEKAGAAYEEFKQMKKQMKTVVANQKLRLELALSAERQWNVEKWQELFVKNPVMHQFAIGLIWGIYEEGSLKFTFRYMEDGSFNTQEEEEFELPAEGNIGLVHPIEMEKEAINLWKEQLTDYEIIQPIVQLERSIYRVTEEEKDTYTLARFGGKILNDLSLSGKLLGMGWYRGSVQDAGGYYTFYREDSGIGAELEFSGSFVGGMNEDVTVYGVKFYKAGSVKRGSYVYDEIKKENAYLLSEVPARYFSEIVYQLEKATASSTEKTDFIVEKEFQ